MRCNIPSPEQVAQLLAALETAQLRELAESSGVPFTTLWKIRSGETSDPRLSTIRSLVKHLKAPQKKQTFKRADGVEVEDERKPENASQFIPPRRRSTDKPSAR